MELSAETVYHRGTMLGALRGRFAVTMVALACAGASLGGAPLLTGCGAGLVQTPKATVRAYAQAVSEGRADDAYAMLSTSAKATITPEAFRKLVKENRTEALELGKSLSREPGDPQVTSTVVLDDGEVVTMVLEDGKWRVDGAALEFYGQATPRQAVRGFVRAYLRNPRRYDVLIKYVPESHKEGLDEKKLAQAWGEGPEAKRVLSLVESVREALPTATFEETGDRAMMQFSTTASVTLVREQGLWKIEDMRDH